MIDSLQADKNQIDQPKARRTWLEKHGKLIAKLQSDFQLPQVTDQSSTSTRFHTFNIGSLNFLVAHSAMGPRFL